MSYTMADFRRDYIKEYFPQMTPEEQREVLESLPLEKRREILLALSPERQGEILLALSPEVLESLPLEKRLAGLSEEQIRQYLEQRSAGRSSQSRKPRRKR